MNKIEMDAYSAAQEANRGNSPPVPYNMLNNMHYGHHDVNCHACHHSACSLAPPDAEKRQPNVVPVSLLQRWPARVECPACKEVSTTAVKHETGKGTHAMAVMFFFTTGVGAFIPYVCNSMKDVRHNCTKCGRILATRHYGSTTESHLL